MRNILFYCASALCLLFIAVKPSLAGPCSPDNAEAPGIYVPDRGCAEIGFGYQYQHYDVLGKTFSDNGYNVDLGLHLFDWVTGGEGRLTVGAEGTTAFGFGHTNGPHSLDAKSLFIGGGPHAAIQSHSRLEPWIHVLPGWEHFRFTQTSKIGSNSPASASWLRRRGGCPNESKESTGRIQADYLGTTFQSTEQSSYSFGTGLIFYF